MSRARQLGLGVVLALVTIACGQPTAPRPEAAPQEPVQGPVEEAPVEDALAEVPGPAAAPAAQAEPTERRAPPNIETSAPEAPTGAPRAEDPAPVAAPVAAGECGPERASIERELRKSQRCTAKDECAMVNLHHAFGPCGTAARKDAPLDELRERAARYAERCNPPVTRVRCAHRTGALCTKGSCILASPEQLEAAGVEPVQIGY
jgi:hypothetical protein